MESWQLDEKVFGRGIRRRELNTGRQRGREWMWLLFVGSFDLKFDERKAWDVMESEKGLGTEAGTQQPSSSQQHRQAVNSEPNSKYRGRQKAFHQTRYRAITLCTIIYYSMLVHTCMWADIFDQLYLVGTLRLAVYQPTDLVCGSTYLST